MTIIVVDDEPIILSGEINVIRKVSPEADITGFNSPVKALAFIANHSVDIAFLDIEMPGMNGVELAKKIKQIRPETNIIFSTAYDDYYAHALKLHASGYLLKPIKEADVRAELDDLRYKIEHLPSKKLFIRTFGDFEVFFDGVPLKFRYQKTSELLAYLVDRRGAIVDNDTLITILWGGETDKTNFLKQVRKDLKDTFTEKGCGDLLLIRRGGMGLHAESVPCDYFDWLKGNPEGIKAYHGEYMRQYSWAEPTWVNLEGKSNLWEM